MVFGKIHKRALVLGTCLAAFPFAAGEALAQDESGDVDAPAAAVEVQEAGLATIIVTAQRREENLQNTPISIAALSPDDVAKTGAQDIAGVASFVPNLSIGPSVIGSTMPNFSIRGIGQSSTRAHQEPGVAIYVDDLYYPRSLGSTFQVVDLERVEVLRGPQGTLFGRNAVGGAIRFVTAKPVYRFEGRISATTGSFDRHDFEGMLNVPLSDTLAVRVQGASLNSDGYINQVSWDRISNTLVPSDRTLGDRNDLILRGALRFEPTSDLTIDLSASYMESDINPAPAIVRSITPNFGFLQTIQRAFYPQQVYLQQVLGVAPLGVDDPLIVAPGYYTDIDRCILDDPGFPLASLPSYDVSSICDPQSRTENEIYNATVNYNVSDTVSLKSVTGYQRLDNESTLNLWGLDGPAGQADQASTFSQEIQLLLDTDRFNFTGGLFYFRHNADEQTFPRQLGVTTDPANPINIIGEDGTFSQVSKAWAIYGQGTFDATDDLHLTAGLRYTQDRKTAILTDTGASGGAPFENSLKFDSLDYSLSARYEFTPEVSLYGSVSTSYKAGGFNNRLVVYMPFNPPPAPPVLNSQPVVRYSPEHITNFEMGFRSELFDNSVRFNVTGYYMLYSDIIQEFIDFSGVRGAQIFSVNSADTEIIGTEVELSWAVTSRLQLDGSLAYNHIKFTDIAVGSPALIQASCPGVSPPTPDQCDAQYYARAPKVSWSMAASYTVPLDSGSVILSGNVGYTGTQQSHYSAISSIRLPAYTLGSVRAEYRADDGWSLAGFVTNLFDEQYPASGAFGGLLQADSVVEIPGRPREWGVNFSYEF